MFIRSQDGCHLVNMAQVMSLDITETTVIIASGAIQGTYMLGHYATKERAIQVMRQIENNIIACANDANPECSVFIMPAE